MSQARRTSRTPGRTLGLLALLLLIPVGLAPAARADVAPVRPHAAARKAAPPAVPPRAAQTEQTEQTEQSEPTEPLTVTMTSLSPAEIPAKGAVSIAGTVTNDSGDAWTDVNVSPFVSRTPITSRDELALAAATESSATVGTRLTDPSTLQTVGDLLPGQSASFSLRVPVTLLGTQPGVYWIGVHALGATAEGRDLVADGRARSFIPLMPRERARGEPTPVSVVLSLRERVRRDALGRVNGPSRWADLTAESGRISHLTELATSAGAAPLTWVVDPAVLDALDDIAHGNKGLALGSTRRRPDAGKGPSPAPVSPGASGLDEGTLAKTDRDVDEATRNDAARVLGTFLTSARGSDLLALGYADPDVAALARQRPQLLDRANALSTRRLAARGLEGSRAVAPPDGYFDPDELAKLSRDALLIVSDQGKEGAGPPSTRLPTGQHLVLSDARASSGGPAPSRTYDALAVRQRVLSDAALEQLNPSLDGRPRPIVVQLPARWDPGPAWREADLFGALTSARWLRLAPLDRGATTTYAGKLAYGRSQLAQELGAVNVGATRQLARTGTVLGHLLANTNDVADTLTGAALTASSYSARDSRRQAVEQTRALDTTTRERIDRVTASLGDDFVTLSGGSGALTVTIVNGLKQPITVGLRARTDSDVRIKVPDPIALGAGQRYTTRLPVSSRPGVHKVWLQPVTTEGEDAGTPTAFSLRTSQVGQLIWFILAGGGLLLAVMIARRIVLRVRDHRWRRHQGVEE